MATLVLLALLGQYPPESQPIQPAIPILWMTVPAPALDLPAAPPGEPIDQLVLCPSNVFTSQADCTTYMQQAQTAANAVYAADPANPTRVRLTGVYLPTYVAPNNMSTELVGLQQNTLVGVDVKALRDQYRGDRVSLIDTGTGSCGLAYVNAATFGPQWAFSVIDRGCGISNSSLWHEWGHNDGLCHDEPNSTGCTPAKPYGYGFCDPLGNQKSPMAYPSPCNKPRKIFSNKDNTWTYGHPYGDATHDEAAVQRWAMPIEANFYPPLSGPAPAAPGKPVLTEN